MDGERWRLWYTVIPEAEAMTKEIDRRLGQQGTARCCRSRSKTGWHHRRYATHVNVDATNKRIEIGAATRSHPSARCATPSSTALSPASDRRLRRTWCFSWRSRGSQPHNLSYSGSRAAAIRNLVIVDSRRDSRFVAPRRPGTAWRNWLCCITPTECIH
jgi:hypothetical protein